MNLATQWINQYEQFETLVTQAEKPKFIHSQNSAGSLLRNFELCNAVRLGISLYGYYPSAYVKKKLKLNYNQVRNY